MEKPEGEDINKQVPKKASSKTQQIPSVGLVKLNEFHRTIDAINRFYERTESATGASSNNHDATVGPSMGKRRQMLLNLAQQTESLDDPTPLLKCDEAGGESVVWLKIDSAEFTQLIQLLECLKTLNEFICNEILRETKIFGARNPANIIDNTLEHLYSAKNALTNNKGPISSENISVPIHVDKLCSIWRSIEHNSLAFQALIHVLEDENDHLLVKKRTERVVFESASNLLLHELYATIVRLSNVGQTIAVHEQNDLRAIDNLLLDENVHQLFDTILPGKINVLNGGNKYKIRQKIHTN